MPIEANDKKAFVDLFVPLDCTEEDSAGFLGDLNNATDGETHWVNLTAEIRAIESGKGVSKIELEGANKVVYYFEHPLLPGCDREVEFVRAEGEWRAGG